MAKEGFPFVIIPALIAMLLAFFQLWILASAFALIAGFMAFFFRDPYREVPDGEGLIVAAADGRVTRIDETDDGKLVSVFMSPFDVHINRSPIAGTIQKAEYIAGKKAPATSNSASFTNERNSLTINGDVLVRCTQIAGIVARRIVCWNKEGDELKRGQKFGLIKFSSRTDVLMPVHVELMVKIGDHVKGGQTVLAKVLQTLPTTKVNDPVHAAVSSRPVN